MLCVGLMLLKSLELSDTEVGSSGLQHLSGLFSLMNNNISSSNPFLAVKCHAMSFML